MQKWLTPSTKTFHRLTDRKHLQSVGKQHLVRLIATVATDELRVDFVVALRRTAVRSLLLLRRCHAGRSLIFWHLQYLLVLL